MQPYVWQRWMQHTLKSNVWIFCWRQATRVILCEFPSDHLNGAIMVVRGPIQPYNYGLERWTVCHQMAASHWTLKRLKVQWLFHPLYSSSYGIPPQWNTFEDLMISSKNSCHLPWRTWVMFGLGTRSDFQPLSVTSSILVWSMRVWAHAKISHSRATGRSGKHAVPFAVIVVVLLWQPSFGEIHHSTGQGTQNPVYSLSWPDDKLTLASSSVTCVWLKQISTQS